jgi:hypothetical protein
VGVLKILPYRGYNKPAIPIAKEKEDPMPPKSKLIFQFKVTLKDSKPPIWRRIQVRSDTRLDQMHDILQVVMAWWDYHLHQFIIYDEYYGVPDDDYMDFEMHNEKLYKLHDFAAEEGFKCIYEYDFGDSWEHILELEKILPAEKDAQYPLCLKGKRARPPEDVGGIWGYVEFLEAVNDPEHEEHDEYLEWVGGEFDPEEFDLDEINEGLKNLKL